MIFLQNPSSMSDAELSRLKNIGGAVPAAQHHAKADPEPQHPEQTGSPTRPACQNPDHDPTK